MEVISLDGLKIETVCTHGSTFYFMGNERRLIFRLLSYLNFWIKGDLGRHRMTYEIRRKFNLKLRSYRFSYSIRFLVKSKVSYILPSDFSIFSQQYAVKKKGEVRTSNNFTILPGLIRTTFIHVVAMIRHGESDRRSYQGEV